jgi:hypothetical protein
MRIEPAYDEPARVRTMAASRKPIIRAPLLRLLAVNLAAGAGLAVLLLGGLLALDPHGLRGLILADRSPATAIGLLLFGLFITFGSAAMGTAIMALGALADGGRDGGASDRDGDDGRRGGDAVSENDRVAVRLPVRSLRCK